MYLLFKFVTQNLCYFVTDDLKRKTERENITYETDWDWTKGYFWMTVACCNSQSNFNQKKKKKLENES